jgi:hypothetical protein
VLDDLAAQPSILHRIKAEGPVCMLGHSFQVPIQCGGVQGDGRLPRGLATWPWQRGLPCTWPFRRAGGCAQLGREMGIIEPRWRAMRIDIIPEKSQCLTPQSLISAAERICRIWRLWPSRPTPLLAMGSAFCGAANERFVRAST